MSLEKQISTDIMSAMKARDAVALSALRNVKKFIIEAKTAGTEIAELEDAQVIKIITKLVKQGKDSADLYIQQNRQDLADEELGQVGVMERYLPKKLSSEELENRVRQIISDTGATSVKDMGKVMGLASKQLAGLADGKDIADMVRRLLA